MLHRATNADGHIEVRPHRHPRLADLEHLRDPAAVDRLARGRDGSAEKVRQVLEHPKGLRDPEAVAAAHDDRGFLRTEAALFCELLQIDERRVDIRWTELDLLRDDLARPARVVRGRDEDVSAHRCHLRPMLLAQDVRQALPAETGPDHVEVALRVDVEFDAVGRQAGLENRMKSAPRGPVRSSMRRRGRSPAWGAGSAGPSPGGSAGNGKY